MTLLLTLLIMGVIALVAAVAAGRIHGGLDDAASSLPGRGLPPGPFTLDDVDRVTFSPALRGYRMDEVDDVVDRLVEELRRRDEEVAQLRARAGRYAAAPDGEGGAPDPDPARQAYLDAFRDRSREVRRDGATRFVPPAEGTARFVPPSEGATRFVPPSGVPRDDDGDGGR